VPVVKPGPAGESDAGSSEATGEIQGIIRR
jgi:hypothetical protein